MRSVEKIVETVTEVVKRPYYIKVCDPSIPHVEHPNSCYKFLHCKPTKDGSYEYAVKTCYPDMMYNPTNMICDWPDSVKKIKPSCGVDFGEIEIWETEEIISIRRSSRLPTSTQRSVSISSGGKTYIENQEVQVSYHLQICDPTVPLVEHPESCFKYLQCQQMPNGSYIYVEQVCGATMMFNPKNMICDWPSSVKAIKPICDSNRETIDTLDLKTLPPRFTTMQPTQPPMKIIASTKPTFTSTISSSKTTPRSISGLISQEIIELPSYITICDPSVPHVEHPNSCYKFLHCQPAVNGSYVYAVKTCYPDTMFNPKSMICDWPDSVKKIKPSCGVDFGEIEIWETEEIISRRRSSRLPTSTQRSVFISSTRKVEIDYVEVQLPYYIRTCDPTIPMVEHPESCHKYLECLKLSNGSFMLTEKTCGPDLMFDPFTKDCYWNEDVIASKPQCRDRPGVIEVLDLKIITKTSPVTTVRPETTAKITRPGGQPIIIPTTLTPPVYCDKNSMVPLLSQLPDSAFSASSILGNAFKPEFARLDSKPSDKSSGSWTPRTNDENQFLEVNFPRPIPIYGVIIRGNPMFDQYVTNFKILHSYDGISYHVYENSRGETQKFSGSVDSKTPVRTIFEVPIEARIVRIYPISWNSAIALRVEFLGCQKPSPQLVFNPEPTRPILATTLKPIALSTPSTRTTLPQMFTESPIEPLCDDPLGVENSKLSSNQIKFSSIKDPGSVKTKVRKNALEVIKLSSSRGWMPLADSTNEFVMVN